MPSSTSILMPEKKEMPHRPRRSAYKREGPSEAREPYFLSVDRKSTLGKKVLQFSHLQAVVLLSGQHIALRCDLRHFDNHPRTLESTAKERKWYNKRSLSQARLLLLLLLVTRPHEEETQPRNKHWLAKRAR